MDGVIALRQLAVGHGPLMAAVPAQGIAAGPLPQGTTLPAISLESVSRVERNIASPGAKRRVTERVQATVHASSYLQLKAVLKLMRDAAADKMPSVAGISQVTVHLDGAGPDFRNEAASIFLGSQDFKVAYNEMR